MPGELRADDKRMNGMIFRQFGRAANCYLHAAFVLLLILLSYPFQCYSADVVFVRSSEASSIEQSEVEMAAHFYGLRVIVIAPGANDAALNAAIVRPTTLAVVVAANALDVVNERALLGILNKKPTRGVPLLIVGVNPTIDSSRLKSWSGGAADGCRRVDALHQPQYSIGLLEGVTRELTDRQVPYEGNDAVYFLLGKKSKARQIMMLRDDSRVYPVFIQTLLNQQQVFLSCTLTSRWRTAAEWDAQHMANAFMEIAPIMMFIRFCAGDRGWHTLYHYANLTVDDPWLREPYGHLSYSGLLTEMEKHNFHSTIAFIPWNYDRSEPGVISLIRAHPDRFSICIHGDNHDHKEFTDYQNKPLTAQIFALKQGLARMDRFRMLTGIPYDKVMVFPHSIAPEKTLGALKTYNYLASINSSNVPMDRMNPLPLPFALRPVTVSFGDFASIRRYPADGPISSGFVSANAFLDNPLFLYCHQDFFASGINAFDTVADQVNTVVRGVRWRSVGEIVRQLYLVRLRDDAGYDVLAFSSNFCLANISKQDSIFYVRKKESGHTAIRSITVDDQSIPYRVHEGYLEFNTLVTAGKNRCVAIQYENDLRLGAVDASKDSLRIYLLRMASDFRDIALSRFATGRDFIRFYTKHGVTPGQLFVCVFILIVSCLCGAYAVRTIIGRFHRMKRTPVST